MSFNFNDEGRYNRAKFNLTMFAFSIVLSFVIYAFGILIGLAIGEIESRIYLIHCLLFFILSGPTVVKRLHDLDMPDWYWWLQLIPIYGQYLGLVLIFKKGTNGPNRFGPDPLQTLLESQQSTSSVSKMDGLISENSINYKRSADLLFVGNVE